MKKSKQLTLNIYQGTHGGRRPNSGRKRIHSKGVSHAKREKVRTFTPLHVNFKYKLMVKNKEGLKALHKAIKNARTHELKIIHFSLQHNHVHLIIEASSNKILTKGMRSLTITLAKLLNKGRIQLQRFHLHVLKTNREIRNAVRYVLFNERKHSGKMTLDSYSSVGLLGTAKKIAATFKITILERPFTLPNLDHISSRSISIS
ncbi:MAG: transposase [Bdellovibrionota bacterium]